MGRTSQSIQTKGSLERASGMVFLVRWSGGFGKDCSNGKWYVRLQIADWLQRNSADEISWGAGV